MHDKQKATIYKKLLIKGYIKYKASCNAARGDNCCQQLYTVAPGKTKGPWHCVCVCLATYTSRVYTSPHALHSVYFLNKRSLYAYISSLACTNLILK